METSTYERSNFCWAILRWTAQSDTLALSLRMRWLSLKSSKSNGVGRLHGRPQPDNEVVVRFLRSRTTFRTFADRLKYLLRQTKISEMRKPFSTLKK
ncbi:hypothetical protein BZA02_102260 [Ruegeria sp. P4]|nr:hypothetical protein BZA02_102260 [Ruegeria sp. P4]